MSDVRAAAVAGSWYPGTREALQRAVDAYNKAVGSLESRVLVAARRFQDLSVTDDELPAPRQVESSTRSLGTGRGAVELHPVDRRAAREEGDAENSVAL